MCNASGSEVFFSCVQKLNFIIHFTIIKIQNSNSSPVDPHIKTVETHSSAPILKGKTQGPSRNIFSFDWVYVIAGGNKGCRGTQVRGSCTFGHFESLRDFGSLPSVSLPPSLPPF